MHGNGINELESSIQRDNLRNVNSFKRLILSNIDNLSIEALDFLYRLQDRTIRLAYQKHYKMYQELFKEFIILTKDCKQTQINNTAIKQKVFNLQLEFEKTYN